MTPSHAPTDGSFSAHPYRKRALGISLAIAIAAASTLLGASSAQAWDYGHPGHPG